MGDLSQMISVAKMQKHQFKDAPSIGTVGDHVVVVPPGKDDDSVEHPIPFILPDDADIKPLTEMELTDNKIDADIDDVYDLLQADLQLDANTEDFGLEDITPADQNVKHRITATIHTAESLISETFKTLEHKVGAIQDKQITSGIVAESSLIAASIASTASVIAGISYLVSRSKTESGKPDFTGARKTLDGLIEKITWPYGKISLKTDGKYKLGRLYVWDKRAKSATRDAASFKPTGTKVSGRSMKTVLHDISSGLNKIKSELFGLERTAEKYMHGTEKTSVHYFRWIFLAALLAATVAILMYVVVGGIRVIRHRLEQDG